MNFDRATALEELFAENAWVADDPCAELEARFASATTEDTEWLCEQLEQRILSEFETPSRNGHEPDQRETAALWIDRIWGEERGHFLFAFGVDGHYTESGKYEHTHWQERHGRWPDDRDRFLDEAIEKSAECDVYVAPYLRSAPSRKKGHALPSRFVYADIDELNPANDGFERMLIGPGGLLVNSGRGLHPYLLLPDVLKPVELEMWNRRLAQTLGADAGWAENKVLRLPGTWNHKPRARGGQAAPVSLVEFEHAQRDWTLEELDGLLAQLPAGVATNGSLPAIEPEMPADIPPRVATKLTEKPGDDRSAQMHSFVRVCLSNGLSEAETLALTLQHPPTVDKFGERAAGEIRRSIEKLRQDAPAPTSNQPPEGGGTGGSASEADTRPLKTVRVDQIEMRSIEWLDKPQLQNSAFHLLAGPKGVGKGTWLARTTAAMTTGVYGEPRNVIIVSSEDSAAIDTKPRLVAAGADLTRVQLVTDHLVLPRDIFRMEDLANETGNVGLIIIDPVGNHLGGIDTDKEGLVRHAIGGLNKLADDLKCVVLGVRHIGKSRQSGALAAVLGSTAWVDLPRAVLAFARDDEDDMVFHVQVVAGNRSGRSAALSYRIELRDVGLLEPVTCAAAIGETLKNVDELLAAPRRASKSQSARELILDILETEGDQESDTLDARIAKETGLTAKTIRNQRAPLVNEGLIKSIPEMEAGAIVRWKVVRTAAPRKGQT